MNKLIKIAWRNLWRNKKRTLITAASIFFAVFFAILMRSFQLGSYDYMIDQSIEAFSGYLQVQSPDYSDDPSLENSFVCTPEILEKINQTGNIKAAVPRIESFALASNGSQSKGVLVSGISPEMEKKLSNPYHQLVRYRFEEKAISALEKGGKIPAVLLKKIRNFQNYSFSSEARIELDLGLSKEESKKYLPEIVKHTTIEANYLSETDDGVLVSDKLSKYLKVDVGDSIVLMGQGYEGSSAAGIFPIRGIVKVPSPELDNKLVYMTLAAANTFYGLDGRITAIAINLHNNDEMQSTQQLLSSELPSTDFVVKNWEEITPTLKQQIEGDSKSGQIFLAVIYIIVFFGIFGTVMMMVAERMKEFGMMVAVGMKQAKLATILTLEMFFLGIIGAVSGTLASIPLILLGHYYPVKLTGEVAKMYEDMGFQAIMPTALFDPYFFTQGMIILVMVFLACYSPVRSILKINVIKAIHG
ncbi:MAG TPA: FtsX-like permease family protein [Prolixibacteraceae bacterium]|nr:FtsX-like permease family protein [Prolixibacteraceae bacterium]HPS12098.1 FtsX-like permease family protein [Prolixibacteraceae bacterium]